jgi:hypothetical protein
MKNLIVTAALVCSAGIVSAYAQTQPPAAPQSGAPAAAPQPAPRPASPAGSAQTQVAGTWGKNSRGTEVYQNGKWIEITYGRPIMKGRDVWGSGPTYAKGLLVNGATVWRAGANVATQLNTEVPLVINGKTVAPGTYTMFIDTKSPTEWTLIISTWGAKKSGGDQTPDTLWGSFNYTPDKDVVRAPMTIAKLPVSFDQLTWNFVDMKGEGGKIAIMWDNVIASVPFTVSK